MSMTNERAVELREEMPRTENLSIWQRGSTHKELRWSVRGKEWDGYLSEDQAVALSQAPAVIDHWRAEAERLRELLERGRCTVRQMIYARGETTDQLAHLWLIRADAALAGDAAEAKLREALDYERSVCPHCGSIGYKRFCGNCTDNHAGPTLDAAADLKEVIARIKEAILSTPDSSQFHLGRTHGLVAAIVEPLLCELEAARPIADAMRAAAEMQRRDDVEMVRFGWNESCGWMEIHGHDSGCRPLADVEVPYTETNGNRLAAMALAISKAKGGPP